VGFFNVIVNTNIVDTREELWPQIQELVCHVKDKTIVFKRL
jgi:hypothetical protein